MDNAILKRKFRQHSLSEVNYALADIKKTLDLWKDADTDYTRKLWSEWDYLVVLKQKLVAQS